MGFARFQCKIITIFLLVMMPLCARAQVMIGYSPLEMRAAQTRTQSQQQTAARSAPSASAPVSTAQSQSQYTSTTQRQQVQQTRPQPRAQKQEKAPVDFQADKLDYDETSKIITATGNVFLTQEDRIVRADKVVYDLSNDTVNAYGHVVLNEPNGDVHYSQKLLLRNKFKDGVVEHLTSVLSDGSRFTSEKGHRVNGEKTVMRDASYTSCEACKENPDAEPAWQIKASKVTHHSDEQRISYNNARFEVYGVPFLYVPYFSHPDGSVDRKSGFLAPNAGFKSDQGMMVNNRYYWNIAPEQDATIGLMAYTQETPLVYGQWRRRWDHAAMELNAGITHSGYKDSVAGNEVEQDDTLRGHFQGEFLWNMNDKWRSGAEINWASDDQYMNQYDFDDEDTLVSDFYAERFSDRNYGAVHFLSFQDTRILEEPVDQPEVIPEILANFQGDPGKVPLIGGSWFANTSYLGLRREGDDEQDVDRLSFEGGWKRHFVSDYGLVTDATLSARQDFYHQRDLNGAGVDLGESSDATEVRMFPQAHVVTSYPVVKNGEDYQTRIEPVVAFTAAPNINVSSKIPNEDSQDVQLDADNLFNADRFPGLDRVEDQSRITYGIRNGYHFYNGGDIRTFLGQSYRFEDDDNPFPTGSGLSQRSSDVVGSIEAAVEGYNIDYRFQLDSRHLNSNRHEVDAGADWGRYNLSTQYLYAKSIAGGDFDVSREQIKVDAGYYWNEQWRSRAGVVNDFGETEGLRRAYLGLEYYGQCVSWGLVAERNYTDDISGESDLEISFRLGLKNLGEFERSEWNN